MDTDEYIVAVREMLEEPESDNWTQIQLVRYLNWSINIVLGHLAHGTMGDFYYEEGGSLVSIVSGTQEYAFPVGPDSTKLIWLKAIERVWKEGAEDFLDRVQFGHRNRYSTVGGASRRAAYPQRFYQKGLASFGIVPKPEIDIASALKVHGVFANELLVYGDGKSPKFDDLVVCQRAAIIRTAMFAKHIDEVADAGLSAEWRAAVAEMRHDLAYVGDQEETRPETADDDLHY